MNDMSDGTMWTNLMTGIKREVGNFGTVRDMLVDEGTEQKLTDNRIGLHLVINLDWYVFHFNNYANQADPIDRFGALQRPHSTGPAYITIADLP